MLRAPLAEVPLENSRWPRELLGVLVLAPPILGLVFEPDGLRHDLWHQARSLLAIWIYVMALGLGIQVLTDAIERHHRAWLARAVGAVRHVGVVLALVVALTLVLALPLVWVCPGLDGRIETLGLRGALLASIYVLAGRLYRESRRAREAAAAARARSEQQLSEARYAALVARTQPHFLHNALATAAGLVPDDPRAAEAVLRDLGALFREVVSATTQDRVRAADELETARRYLEVQRARFAPRLTITIEGEPLAGDELVPPLVLLPFVENAVLHGLSDGGATHITLRLALEADNVAFTVEDDGPGARGTTHAEGTGVGTDDVRRRLETLYGAAASIVSEPLQPRAAREGLRATLRIPRDGE